MSALGVVLVILAMAWAFAMGWMEGSAHQMRDESRWLDEQLERRRGAPQ